MQTSPTSQSENAMMSQTAGGFLEVREGSDKCHSLLKYREWNSK